MSFRTSLINAPEEAEYWMPIFYYRDPVTGAYTPYYPEDYLNISQSWLCPLSAGDGIMVDYRCVVYDSDFNIIGTRDLHNIVVIDGEEFAYELNIQHKKQDRLQNKNCSLFCLFLFRL